MNYLTTVLIIILICLGTCDKAEADTAHINYVTSTNDQYTQLKSELEDLGYTVTGTNSGSVTLSDFSSKDLHINIAGDSNCGNSCKTAYETYIGNGGNVIIAGNGVYNNNRTGSIEALIESKLSVGQITLLSYNANFVSYANGSYSGDATAGYWVTRNLFSMQSGGTALGSNNSTGTHAQKSWAKYDYGSNGGQLFVTFDQTQFKNTNSSWMTRFYAYLQQTLTNEGVLVTTPQAAISTSQQTEVNTAKAKTQNGNAIYLTQSGNGIDLDIVQDGDNNLITGSDLTNAGSIQGDNNEITLTQTNDGNVLGIDVNGNSNNVDIVQNTNQNAVVNITGASNTLDLEQIHLNNSGSHYSKVTVNGSSNSLTVDQKETGDKILFLDVDSSNNVQVDQKGTGDHYLNIILTDSHTLDITQDGSGDHDAHINLSGNNTSITLTQDSSTDQNYYLEQNCASTSCSATVTQN
jgi:hypothetical protein